MQSAPARDSARAFGVLATSFNEALQEARAALSAHPALVPAARLAEIEAMLAEFARRRVRIAVYGEVKAGKSTLVNALAGAVLSPTAFDPLTSVPVCITYGPTTSWRIDRRKFADVDQVAQLMRERGVDGREVLVTTPLDILQLGGQVDVIDTPGVGSEEHLDAISAEVVRSLDAVVLVVRYPALFTQYTRRLVGQLQGDNSKLFVVWNLDAACRELSAEQRTRQGETLRANVAGAHELFLVDGRQALDAATSKSEADLTASGLPAFVSGLAAFAGSQKREVVALREAAKRAQAWLAEPVQSLSERHGALEQSLAAVRQRLGEVEQRAEQRVGQVRAQFANLEAAITQSGEQYRARVREFAAVLRKQLRGARRHWVNRADVAQLQISVDAATHQYADNVDGAALTGIDALREAAATFGAVTTAEPRPRHLPAVDTLCPPERDERSRTGSMPLLRRALWRNWYLPGLTQLETKAIDEDIDAQEQWFAESARVTESAGRVMLDARIAEIRHAAEVDSDAIKQETGFVADSAELEALAQNLPALRTLIAQVDDICAEAWYLQPS